MRWGGFTPIPGIRAIRLGPDAERFCDASRPSIDLRCTNCCSLESRFLGKTHLGRAGIAFISAFRDSCRLPSNWPSSFAEPPERQVGRRDHVTIRGQPPRLHRHFFIRVHSWLFHRGAGSGCISIHRVLNSKAGEIGEADDAYLWFALSAPSARSAVEDPGDSESPLAVRHAP